MLNSILTFITQIFKKKVAIKDLSKLREDVFASTLVEELMLTRSDISAANANINLAEICKLFIQTEHTRIPIYQDDLDNILGFVHVKDVFKIVATNNQFNLKNILRKPIITTSSRKILDLFNEMQKKRVHIAIVIDEYGGTQGLITIEDIIEKQLGNINDEYDDEPESHEMIIKKNDYYIALGRAKIDDIEKKLEISLTSEESDYETIAGMIIAKLQFIPKTGHQIILSNILSCTILEATPRIIKKIKIEIINLENNE